ncbi:hypothetical protein UFOVP1605_15 [uncultured Caudovirales phage]|uniref:Uncharacterized protein n=1 Tax=uncultured Caudovirales phage TaxID=2100421 RepID=A0A6J5ST47_9CAUD|nr:hypothetical protein UFOVP1605_15 [uncultured Caudovirales phage]
MANEKQEIVLEIQVQGSIDNLAKLRSEMDSLIKTRQDLSAKSKEGDIEATKEIEKVNSAVRNMQTEYKAQQRVLDGYNASVKTNVNTSNLQANSIQQNRDLLKQLTAQYIQLKSPSENATSQIKHLSDVLKEQESAIGNNTRKVGDYKGALLEAFKELNGIGKVIDPIKNMGLAFESAGGGVKGFSLALATTGLPLIISGVNALIDVFKEFGGVADTVEQITAGISGGFTAFVSGGSALAAGKQIASLTADLQKLNEQGERSVLVTEQTNAAIKRLQVDAKDRTKTEKERIGLYKQADDLAEKLWKDNDARLTKQALKEEEVFAAKHNLTEMEVRLAIFSNDVIKKQYDFLTDEQIDKKRDAVGEIVKLDGEEVKKLIEGRVKITQSLEAYTDILDKNAVKSNKLADDAKAKADKQVAEDAARNEKLKQQKEQYLKNLESLETEFYLNDREKLAKTFEDKIASITGSSQRETQLRLTIAQEEVFALEKFDKDYAEKKKKIQDDERKKQEEQELKDIQGKYDLESSFLQKQLEIELGYIDLSNKSVEEKRKEKENANILFLERQLQRTIDHLGADGDITKAEIQGIEAIRLKLKQAKADAAKPTPETYFESLGINQDALGKAEKTLQGFAQIVSSINDIVTKGFQIRENEIESQKNHEIEAVQSSTLAQKEKDAKIRQINKQAAQEKYQLELQAFNTSKGIQIVQAIISTALGVVNGLNAGLSLGPAGVVMGPVLAALAGVTGAVQIALIASQQPPPPPQFARGVIGLDGEGTETSDSIDARLSKGESVMTAKATKKFHRELAYMEMSVGNSPNYQIGRGNFASGFIPSPNVVTSDGGFASREMQRNSDNSSLIQQAIQNGFKLAPAPVLSIVEFQTKQNDRNRSVNISEA